MDTVKVHLVPYRYYTSYCVLFKMLGETPFSPILKPFLITQCNFSMSRLKNIFISITGYTIAFTFKAEQISLTIVTIGFKVLFVTQ